MRQQKEILQAKGIECYRRRRRRRKLDHRNGTPRQRDFATGRLVKKKGHKVLMKAKGDGFVKFWVGGEGKTPLTGNQGGDGK